jgi:hypothetical protein
MDTPRKAVSRGLIPPVHPINGDLHTQMIPPRVKRSPLMGWTPQEKPYWRAKAIPMHPINGDLPAQIPPSTGQEVPSYGRPQHGIPLWHQPPPHQQIMALSASSAMHDND